MSESSENEDIEMKEEQSDEEVASNEDDDAAAEDTDDEEETVAEEPDVNASATESDEDDDEVDDDKDIPAIKANAKGPSSKYVEKVTNAIKERHEKRKGKQLYIRFPEKLPESVEDFQKKVNALSKLIVESHKPRQKHARFCLVDFATTEDRNKALKELSKNNSKIVVSIPKTDDDDFIKTLVDKKLLQTEKRRAKSLLRKQSKKNVIEKSFTSILLVMNLPSSASTAQIKELFPDAVDIQTKGAPPRFAGTMVATVTLPSTADAKNNVKRKLELGGNKLIIRFNTDKKKKKFKKNKKAPVKPGSIKSNPTKKPTQSPKKKSTSENGSTNLLKKKTKKQKNKPPKKGTGVLAPVE